MQGRRSQSEGEIIILCEYLMATDEQDNWHTVAIIF